jgi:hypothetical protein
MSVLMLRFGNATHIATQMGEATMHFPSVTRRFLRPKVLPIGVIQPW